MAKYHSFNFLKSLDGSNMKYGNSEAMDAYLNKSIEIQYEDCSCDDEEQKMDTSQSQCTYRGITIIMGSARVCAICDFSSWESLSIPTYFSIIS